MHNEKIHHTPLVQNLKDNAWLCIIFIGIYLLLPLKNIERKVFPQESYNNAKNIPTVSIQSSSSDEPFLLRIVGADEGEVTPTATPIDNEEQVTEKIITTPQPLTPSTENNIVDGELLVRFKNAIIGNSIVEEFHHKLEEIPSVSVATGYYRVILPKGSNLELTRELYKQHPEVDDVSYEKIVSALAPIFPNDPLFNDQWALHNTNNTDINAPEAWEIEKGKTSVHVAIIDTGIDALHEDLNGKVREGMNFVGYTRDTTPEPGFTSKPIPQNSSSDDNGHGSSAAGIVGALTNNSKGISGISWESPLVPVKVLDYKQEGRESNTAAGITWAADQQDIKVLCMSLGSSSPSTIIKSAIDYAETKGKVMIAASGNKDRQGVYFPAALPNVIAVGATDKNDERADRSDWGSDNGSSYGPELDILAPGTQIMTSTWRQGSVNSYGNFTGTSAAAPHVCGVAALLLSRDPSLTPLQIKRRLQASATKVQAMNGSNFLNEYGFGRVDTKKALLYDIYPPSIHFHQPSGSVSQLPTFTGQAIDDKTDNSVVQATLADIPTSNIKTIEYRLDNGSWQNLAPEKPIALYNFQITFTQALSVGQHTLEARAVDTMQNRTEESKYAKITFTVAQDITPVPTATSTKTTTTPTTLTPLATGTATATTTTTVASTQTQTPTTTPTMQTTQTRVATTTPSATFSPTPLEQTFEARVFYRYYLSADQKNYKDFPLSGVKVIFSDIQWEQYTNEEGIAFFNHVTPGEHLVSAFYGDSVSQGKVIIPNDKSVVLYFEAKSSSEPSTIDQLPTTGQPLSEQRRIIAGIIFIVTGIWLKTHNKRRSKREISQCDHYPAAVCDS